MDFGLYLIYLLLATTLVWGARIEKRGEWNGAYASLEQMKPLEGAAALFITFHHMAQKTCGAWHEARFIVHGLDPFLPIGYAMCAIFLFASGRGLYVSLRTRPDYLSHFVRRRIVPAAVAYYLSEAVYIAVRLLMGERMSAGGLLFYASGLRMANKNAWYLVAILFFYAVFYAAFRLFRTDGRAIAFVFGVTFLYALAGILTDHRNDGFLCGEWWYNSIILFPLGLLFARHEAGITAFFKRLYALLLPLSAVGLVAVFRLSQYLNGAFGYYGETRGDPYKILHRVMSCSSEWLVCILFVGLCLLVLLKVRFGNPLTALLGRCTLGWYLMHGVFVELFGFDFMDRCKSLCYIRNVPLYVLVVLCCTAAATALYMRVWKKLCAPLRS